MKLPSILLWTSLLATAAPHAWAQANTLPSQPHLLVKGEGTRTVMPDRYVVELLASSVNTQPDAARQSVQGNVEAALSAFKRNHAVPATVRADNLSIQPEQRYTAPGRLDYVGTRVSRRLKGAFSNSKDLQAFLRAVDAGEDLQISGMRPGYSGEQALRAELKSEAATQTRESARRLAEAYDARITGLYSISDVAPNFAYGIQAGSWPRSDSMVIPPAPPAPASMDVQTTGSRGTEAVESGPITYTENVYAIFLISDGT